MGGGRGTEVRPLSGAPDAVIAVLWEEGGEKKASIRVAVPCVRACAHTRRCAEREEGGEKAGCL